jgi:hypothetical protein
VLRRPGSPVALLRGLLALQWLETLLDYVAHDRRLLAALLVERIEPSLDRRRHLIVELDDYQRQREHGHHVRQEVRGADKELGQDAAHLGPLDGVDVP